MKKFSFRLETLLQHRHHLEEKERTKFSAIRNELMAEMKRVQALRTEQARTLAGLAQRKSGNCDLREIIWHYRFLDRIALELERAAKRIAEVEGRLEAQKQVMIEAMRDKKVLENLRSKRKKEYLTVLERTEQKAVDDVVVTRYAHKQ